MSAISTDQRAEHSVLDDHLSRRPIDQRQQRHCGSGRGGRHGGAHQRLAHGLHTRARRARCQVSGEQLEAGRQSERVAHEPRQLSPATAAAEAATANAAPARLQHSRRHVCGQAAAAQWRWWWWWSSSPQAESDRSLSGDASDRRDGEQLEQQRRRRRAALHTARRLAHAREQGRHDALGRLRQARDLASRQRQVCGVRGRERPAQREVGDQTANQRTL